LCISAPGQAKGDEIAAQTITQRHNHDPYVEPLVAGVARIGVQGKTGGRTNRFQGQADAGLSLSSFCHD
jgi:hypothetical protein